MDMIEAKCPIENSNDDLMTKCRRCGEELELGSEPDGCRDPNCPMLLP